MELAVNPFGEGGHIEIVFAEKPLAGLTPTKKGPKK